LAPRLRKEDGWLRLSESAAALCRRVRGCHPWPGAALMTPAGRLLLWRATALPEAAGSPPGTLVAADSETTAIATGDGLLVPGEVQPDSRKAMSWKDFLRGARLGAGARFTEVSG
ncbi:MAG TPA: methionyl-tRNA formyltransferase, partial [Candidatus Methylomirabilis sp.]|nr:methionyl-tRNA formyltransferase [Candidatus Methylomirabilis sp.]